MKLIDKDGLMEIVNCNKSLADGYHMKDYVFKQIITDINNQPTVEAIPIAWLLKWENKHTQEYETYFREIGKYPIECAIEDWRKEHETD